MSHTKEPWKINCHTCESPADIDGGDDYTIVGADGTKIAIEPCGLDPNKGADARRIVACVNACAGIPTDQLEAYPGAVMRVMKERDELLAEMQKAREEMSCSNFNSAAERIDHAIASVKGGAA